MDSGENPILAQSIRGNILESVHRGAAVVVDSSGRVVKSWGNYNQLVSPRSALKFVQALPLIETGAAYAFNVNDAQIALACSSHSGEPLHLELVKNWLKHIGLDESSLECGLCEPMSSFVRRDLLRKGESLSMFHNACSGKHTGFLTTALHMKEDYQGYVKIDHPVQQRIIKTLEEMLDKSLSDAPSGVDGCAIPVFAIELYDFARIMAYFADPSRMPLPRQDAILRITRSVLQHPFMIAGSKRLCTDLIEKSQGLIISKMGAEGVTMAYIPEEKVGIALKIDDGDVRAAEVVLMAILRERGYLGDFELATLEMYLNQPLYNHSQSLVGHLSPFEDSFI